MDPLKPKKAKFADTDNEFQENSAFIFLNRSYRQPLAVGVG
jgi:hypothetical protein